MGRRIVVAEDDPQLLELLSFVLEMEGYEVEPAEDGDQAIELIRRATPDVLISDLEMPLRDGISLLHWVRGEAKLELPVLILTARSRRSAEEDARLAGADRVLVKPVEMPVILRHLADLLGR